MPRAFVDGATIIGPSRYIADLGAATPNGTRESSAGTQRKPLRLADEARIAAIFADGDRGAVPALGMAWGVEIIVDDALETTPVVYVEAGDHERLPRLHVPEPSARPGQETDFSCLLE